ncbi:hypothetical protein [Pseudonocardia spirodelae]|uniref:Serine hydrolase n=1 Tax=Pseudonocardia spirodelae TaxID=3133431 RepID=A0ABU8T244_9PSEU
MFQRAHRRRPSRAGRAAAAALLAALVAVPAVWGVLPDGGTGGRGGTAVAAGPAPPVPDTAQAPPGTLRELVAALTGSAVADPLDLAPGALAVDRAGEEGLELSWALLHTGDGRWTGSGDAASARTEAESTIKAWLAADTLRAAARTGRPLPRAVRADISAAVRASDDAAAERLYRALGRDASIARLGPECGVAVRTSRPGWWSYTQLTPLDSARILACVRERAPGWPGGRELLADLAAVAPDGRSGIHAVLPAPVAEKNGWTLHGGDGWNVNCVLAWADRSLAVHTTYPADRGVDYGWQVCRDVAADVLAAS